MIKLNNEQLQRLYDIFEFEDYETVESATIESERGGFMEIIYFDSKDNLHGCYKPYFAKHDQEDKDHLKYILGF